MPSVRVVPVFCVHSFVWRRDSDSIEGDRPSTAVRRHRVPILDEFATVQYEPVSSELRDRRLVSVVSMLERSHAANDADPERSDERRYSVPYNR